MVVSIKKLERIQAYIEKCLLYFAGILSFLLMLLITLDVICRALSFSLLGVYETTQIVIVAIVFLGVPYLQSIKGHIFIDIVTMKFSEKTKLWMDFFGIVLGMIISSLITWQSVIVAFESVINLEYASGVIHIPVWPAKLIIACSFFFLTTRLLVDIGYINASIRRQNTGKIESEIRREGEVQ